MPAKLLTHTPPPLNDAQARACAGEDRAAVQHRVLNVSAKEFVWASYPVAEEYPLTIYHNDQELVTLLCSPGEERQLVLGFLASEGVITKASEVTQFTLNTEHGLAWVESIAAKAPGGDNFLKRCLTACCGRGRAGLYFVNDAHLVHKVESRLCLPQPDIEHYGKILDELSVTFRATGGVHGGALFKDRRLLCFSQDVGRHNVLDKLYGSCLDQGISMQDIILSFSGRVTSEILLKVSKMNIPVIVARGAPSTLALGLANDLNITVAGFARKDRCSVYTHTERIRT